MTNADQIPGVVGAQLDPARLTLEQVFRRISLLRDQRRLPHKKAGDMLTAIKEFCDWIESPASSVAASEIRIASLVAKHAIGGAALGRSDATVRNIIGRVKAAIRLAGNRTAMPSFTRKQNYSPEWRTIVDELDDLCAKKEISPGHRRGIAHLMGYANWQGIAPVDLSSDHILDLLSLHRSQESSGDKVRRAVVAWNAIVRSGSSRTVPSRELSIPSNKRIVNPDWTSYPATLKADLDLCIGWMRGLDVSPASTRDLDDEFAVPTTQSGRVPRGKAIGAKHAKTIVCTVRQTAGALVRAGIEPGTLTSLASLTTPDAFRISMTDFRRRRTAEGKFDAEEETGTRHLFGTTLIQIAKEWVCAPADTLQTMQGFLEKIRPEHLAGMSPRRAALLRRFDDPQYRTAWYQASDRLVAAAEASRLAGRIDDAALCSMQVALTVEILQCMPARGGNLSAIRIKGDPARRNLNLPKRSRDPIWVSWAGWEVKNGENLKARLTDRAVRVLRLYLQYYWDAALRLREIADSDYLFPSSDPSRPKSEADLNRAFKDRMAQLGLQMTLHLARHLAAKIVLDRDPSLLEVVSRLLGHKSIETTRLFYCENRTEAASQRYQEMILKDALALRAESALAATRVRRKAAPSPVLQEKRGSGDIQNRAIQAAQNAVDKGLTPALAAGLGVGQRSEGVEAVR